VTIINQHSLRGGITMYCDATFRKCPNTFQVDVAAWMALPLEPRRPVPDLWAEAEKAGWKRYDRTQIPGQAGHGWLHVCPNCTRDWEILNPKPPETPQRTVEEVRKRKKKYR
jgi:hypothetical protein